MSSFTLRGVDSMRRRLLDIAREERERLSDATLDEAEHIVERSRNEFVPVRSGDLRDTIQVVKGELSQGRNEIGQFTSGSAVEVKIVAGDESTPYALTVHEYSSEHDPPSWEGVDVQFSPAGRGVKFLERPLMEAIDGMAERVAEKIKV